MAELNQVYVNQYSANCYAMAQQRRSRLASLVTRENEMKGELKMLERVHPTAAVRVNSKYDDSPIIHTPFSRRALRAFEYAWGDMVDWQDDLNILIDPTGKITQAGAAALGRTMDDIIIEQGIFGVAYEGKEGTTPVPFPDSQKVSITAGGTSGNVGLNVEKLIQTRSILGDSELDLDDPAEELYFVYTQKQLDDLLRTTEVKSIDYNAVKALYDGKIDYFMGFKFVRMSKKRIPATVLESGRSRGCFAFAKSCVVYAEPQPISGRIAERADKNFNWYSHMKMKGGATRFQDEGVVWTPCFEA